jgi:hypothetical protein
MRSTDCLVWGMVLSRLAHYRERQWDNLMQKRVPKVICWQEFLGGEFQEQQRDDYQCNHQNRFE